MFALKFGNKIIYLYRVDLCENININKNFHRLFK